MLHPTAVIPGFKFPSPIIDHDVAPRKVTGVGPGLIFAKELLALLRSPGQQIGLVPCAVGGTCMDQWLPGTALFQQMVCTSAALVLDGWKHEVVPNTDSLLHA